MCRRAYKLGAVIAAVGWIPSAFAQDEEALQWSVAPLLGAHSPVLELLNERATKSPLLGIGEIRAEPDDENAGFIERIAFGFENPIEEIGTNTNVGLEFQWRQSDDHTFVLGVTTWEGVSRGATAGQLPVQGKLQNVDYERRMKVSYNEFYLGWQYTLAHKPASYRFYSRVSLNEVFDLDFREEHIFSIKGGELDTVKKIINVTGQTTGVLGFQVGGGGEYFIKRNISLALEGSYFFLERPFKFKDAARDTDLLPGDALTIFTPVRPESAGADVLGYIRPGTRPRTDLDTTNLPVEELSLRLDGWKVFFRINVYY